jgi:hypothetical protein
MMVTGKPVTEDAVFGFRTAVSCLACNDSYFEKDHSLVPGNMKIKNSHQ